MLITHGTIATPGMRRRTINQQVNLGPLSLKIVTIIVIAAASLIALAQSTKSATKNYELQELQKKKEASTEEIERMRTEAIRLQSLQAIAGTQTPSPSPKLEPAVKINTLPATQSKELSQATTESVVQ